MPRIVVLVKHVPDSWSTPSLEDDYTLNRESVDEVIDEINENAVEQALRIKEAEPEAGWQVTVFAAGTPRAEEALRKGLAMGADDAVLLTDEAMAGSDLLGTAWALHHAIAALGEVDIIVAGNASNDGHMGSIPGVLSEYRQIPALTHLNSLSVSGGEVTAVRESREGHYELKAALPVIVSVTEQSGKARFPNFKGIMAAKKADIARLSLSDIGVDPATVGLANAATAVTGATPQPERSRGEIIRDNGDAAEKIADWLRSENLI